MLRTSLDIREKIMKLSVIGLRGFPMVEGGTEKHCESLYPRLKEDIDITVYRRKPYVRSNGCYGRISFVDLPSLKVKGLEPFFHSFISSIHALFKKPDVVHYHNIGPALFSPIVKLRKIPVVVTYHSPNYEHAKWGPFAKRLLMFSEKVAIKTADRIIFVNKFQMDKFGPEVKRKSVYIPNGINDLPVSNKTDYLKKIGVEPGKYILSVGRITQEKGFDTLIKAFRLANVKGMKLVIAGGVEFENGYMKKLRELSEGLDVIFTGYTYGDDLAQLYTNASMFVLASNNEGFPIVLLEAMKYQLDVLVSDIPATRLVNLEEDDYFSRGDCSALAAKIVKRAGKNLRRNYDLSSFNWDVIAAEVSEILHEVAGK